MFGTVNLDVWNPKMSEIWKKVQIFLTHSDQTCVKKLNYLETEQLLSVWNMNLDFRHSLYLFVAVQF